MTSFRRPQLFRRFLGAVLWANASIMVAAQKTAVATNAAASTNILDQDIRPLKEAIPLPDYLFWVWVAAAVLVALIIGWLLGRWWRKRPGVLPSEVVIPPHRSAMDRLRAARALMEEPEPFCTEVSRVIRVYLEERFELNAPERTTEEFLNELRQTLALSPAQKATLGSFLEQCDLVKFARHEPAQPELEELLGTAIRLVEETTPHQEIAERAAAATGARSS